MGRDGGSVLELQANIPTLHAPVIMLSNIRKNRNLLKNLISRDFKVNYHGHILGYFWSMLEPLLLTGIFYLVFVILRQSADSLLPLKIMLGILMFNAFSRTVNGCTLSLVQNSSLIQQIYFPREILPTSIAGFQVMKLILSLFIVIPYMVYESIEPTVYLLLLPIAIIGIMLFAQGLGMIASMIHVRLRDTGQIIQLILRAAFFLSGVFYSAEHIPPEYLHLHLSNPIAVYIEMARAAILGDMGVLETNQVSIALSASFFTYILGSMVFMRYERKAVKHL
jgi:lipopolysaccharide transport system permease protein